MKPENDGTVRVHTEKKGGIDEAKKTFEKLTGEKVPDVVNKPGDAHEVILRDRNGVINKRVQIRYEGRSGEPKIDIKDLVQKIYEKVTFL